ncbi:uncharacterized protein LOC132045892 [Lycium ferocissimum]|uniref:uncharacterized protein LOC132045892 n=1 Tax=Lycium ferocissimum TaxID=112874 RepID=UPI0028157C17|nr:uncharacterized protein LOC132045892 [Lycium ferocissimum]
MEKAYDRVSWRYLSKVLQKMLFGTQLNEMIWRLIVNNWYSILFNGQSTGFFHSTKGVKPGDPLSPALFILSAEVLNRALNALFDCSSYVGYAIVPTKYTKTELHKIFASSFWSNKEEGRSRNWVAWEKVCLPKDEGGLGLDLYMMCQKLFSPNSSGDLVQQMQYGQPSY